LSDLFPNILNLPLLFKC